MIVSVIGLGRMGWHIAAHLCAEHDMTVFDIDPELCGRWASENDGSAAASISEVVQNAEVIVSSLPADAQVRAVVDEAIDSVRPGAVWLDHSTTSAAEARRSSELLSTRGAHFLDAPVSGGVDGAKNGALTVMVGGDGAALSLVEQLLESYAVRVTHMGESGAGQITKMTNQICVVGLCQALAEGLVFATSAGLDASKVVEVMTKGSSTSWEMENRSAQMIAGEYDFGFSTSLMRKDVGLVLDHAAALNLPLPVTALVAEFLEDVDALGGSDWDWCSLMERQRNLAP